MDAAAELGRNPVSKHQIQPEHGEMSRLTRDGTAEFSLVRTHLRENYQALRDSAPCLSRAATLPKATKLELGRGAHLKTPSSAKHTAAASQPIGRIAKAGSWLHPSRVSPALHPPERPSHTDTPKPGFGGRGSTSRGHTGGRSHRISQPPSFCGACINFSREKDLPNVFQEGL